MPEKKFKKVCECKDCGNEAEMTVTCTLEEVDEAKPVSEKTEAKPIKGPQKVKGHAVCSHCGSEADMWIEI